MRLSVSHSKPSLPFNYLGVVVEARTQAFAQTTPIALHEKLLKKEFEKHARKWLRDTQLMSSLTDKYLHESYARIIGMGRPAIPLILERLRRQPGDWFYALRAISGANPVEAGHAGDAGKMIEAWLSWGRERGLCR